MATEKEALPNGAIQALSTAATGALALEIAFIGYWGFGTYSGSVPWSGINLIALLLLSAAFLFLAMAPYKATDSDLTKKKFACARRFFGLGVGLLGAGLVVALAGSWYCETGFKPWMCGHVLRPTS